MKLLVAMAAATATLASGLTRAAVDAPGGHKVITFLRHGQAMHNVNAERLKREGCSHEVFLNAMKEDDVFDAPLTPTGVAQAREAASRAAAAAVAASAELVVASPLSRALDTADLVFPPESTPDAKRCCVEELREINGWMVNAKRKPASQLKSEYAHWDFDEFGLAEEGRQLVAAANANAANANANAASNARRSALVLTLTPTLTLTLLPCLVRPTCRLALDGGPRA